MGSTQSTWGEPIATMEVTKTELGVLSTAPYCYTQNNGYPHGAHGFQTANYSAGFPYNHDEPNEYNRAYAAKHTYHDNMVPAGYTYAAHSGYAQGSGMFAYQGRHGSAIGGSSGMGQAFYGPSGHGGYPYKYGYGDHSITGHQTGHHGPHGTGHADSFHKGYGSGAGSVTGPAHSHAHRGHDGHSGPVAPGPHY